MFNAKVAVLIAITVIGEHVMHMCSADFVACPDQSPPLSCVGHHATSSRFYPAVSAFTASVVHELSHTTSEKEVFAG